MSDMRTVFASVTSSLLDEDPLAAVVLAEISADLFARRRPGTRTGCSTWGSASS